MSRVLLVDTNFSSAPIYDYLLRQGHEVLVVGGNPRDALARSARNYVNLDYSDIDRTRELVRTQNIDYLVPGCNDVSYRVCAKLNEDLRYPGIDTSEVTETLNNKKLFREFALAHSLPVPRLIAPEQLISHWPVIIKPVDAYSGRGVTVLRESQSSLLAAALQQAREYSRTRTCIVEEYVEGQLYSHSAFISEQEIVWDVIVEEHGTVHPFAVDTSRVAHDFPDRLYQAVRDSVISLSRSLQLVDGIVHTQFIASSNAISLIEITRRCPGDLYSKLIQSTTGIDYAENYTRPFLGQKFRFDPVHDTPSWIMRHTISSAEELILNGFRFHIPLQIENLVPIRQTGDRVKAAPLDRIAILFARTDSQDELEEIFSRTIERRLYSIVQDA